jgi:hypothetical protein
MRKRRVYTCQGETQRRATNTGTGTMSTTMMTTNSIERLFVGHYDQHILNRPAKRVSWLQNDSHQIERLLNSTPPTRMTSDPDSNRWTAGHDIFPCFSPPSRDIPDIDAFPSSMVLHRNESLIQQAPGLCDS